MQASMRLGRNRVKASQRLALLTDSRLEVSVGAIGCITLGLLTFSFGIGAACGALLGFALLVAVLTSPKFLACSIVALMPFSTPLQFFGIATPVALDPLDLLIAFAIIAAASVSPVRNRQKTFLMGLIGLNLGLIAVAWLRTYGQASISLTSLAIVIKPLIQITAGFLAVRLIPRSELIRSLGTTMAAVLLLTGASILLQKLGIYESAYSAANANRLDVKRFGGLMLEGNIAGSFIAMFTVPTFLLLRHVGRPQIGRAVIIFAFPVLLITLARGAIVAYAVSLVVLAVIDGRRLETLATVAAVIVLGVVWINSGGQQQANSIQQSTFTTYKTSDTNSQFSGRISIWDTGFRYLNENSSRWLIGGGLDDIRTFNSASRVKFAANTHNSLLFAVVTGGLLMAISFLLLMGWLIFARLPGEPTTRMALRVSVITFLAVGMSLDMNLLTKSGSWIWVLAAAALVPLPDARRSDQEDQTKRGVGFEPSTGLS